MKKSFLFLAVCAAALTACTSEEVIEEGVQSNAISFQNYVGKESRAIDNSTFTMFNVYGYYTKGAGNNTPISVFNGEKVTKANGVWGYTNTRYWVPEAKYYFYAYSCNNNATSGENGTVSMNLEGSSVDARTPRITGFVANNSHQHDLVFATNFTATEGIVGEAADNKAVPFEFKHILSKLNVVFSSDFPAGYEITISDVKLMGMYDKANYNPKSTGNVWGSHKRTTDDDGDDDNTTFINLDILSVTANDATTVYNVAAAANGEVAAKQAKTIDAYVIPKDYAEGEDVTIEFVINVKNTNLAEANQTIISDAVLSGSWNPQWKVGTSYAYNVKISGGDAGLEKIEFSVDPTKGVDDWATGTGADISFSAQ